MSHCTVCSGLIAAPRPRKCATCMTPDELRAAVPAIPRPSPRAWAHIRRQYRSAGHCGGDPICAIDDSGLALLHAGAQRRRRYAKAKAAADTNRDNPPRVEGVAKAAAPTPTNRRGNRAAAEEGTPAYVDRLSAALGAQPRKGARPSFGAEVAA